MSSDFWALSFREIYSVYYERYLNFSMKGVYNMRIKIDTKRLGTMCFNIIVSGVVSEIVNESIKTVKTKVKSIKKKEKEAQ